MTLSADLPGFICGIQAGAADVVHDRRINADKIDIKKGKDGIQMHRCAHFRQLTDNHALRAALFKQRAGESDKSPPPIAPPAAAPARTSDAGSRHYISTRLGRAEKSDWGAAQ